MKSLMTMISVLAIASVASAEFKMAYVDVQRAIEKTVSGKKAKDEMKKEAEKQKTGAPNTDLNVSARLANTSGANDSPK